MNWFADTVSLYVPSGTYKIQWINPTTGAVIDSGSRECAGDELILQTPRYFTDIALQMNRLPDSTVR